MSGAKDERVFCLLEDKFVTTLELFVPDISCAHCQMRIEKAVRAIPGVQMVEVDVAEKKVRVKGDVPRAAVEEAIRELGYTI